jgi:hypothetical protein
MEYWGFKTRKYKGDRLCEAIVGRDPYSYQPHLLKCDKPATVVYFRDDYDSIGALLCSDCHEKMVAKEKG